jgi:hypothetical protein
MFVIRKNIMQKEQRSIAWRKSRTMTKPMAKANPSKHVEARYIDSLQVIVFRRVCPQR